MPAFLVETQYSTAPTNRCFCQNCLWMIDRVRKLKLFCILANLPRWPFYTKICSGQFPPSSPVDIIQANHLQLPPKINLSIKRKRIHHLTCLWSVVKSTKPKLLIFVLSCETSCQPRAWPLEGYWGLNGIEETIYNMDFSIFTIMNYELLFLFF